MNIRDLSYLLALADHQHFGKAAQACFVSQPALSMQIKKLETTLGVTLVERNHKSFLLTEVGMQLSEKARALLQQVEEIKEIAKSFHDPLSGNLKLGIIPTLAPYLLPHLMPSFKKSFKKINFFLIEEKTEFLLTQLHQGKIDCALLASEASTSLNHDSLFTEAFLLAVNKQHPFASHASITLDKLKKESILLLEEGHCLGDQAKQVCENLHLTDFANFRASSLETLRYMVASGIGVTLIPKLAQRKNDGLHYLKIQAPSKIQATLSRQINLYYRPNSPRAPLFKSLAQVIKAWHQQFK